MLVCNVSLRPPRPSIAADLAEAATAVDATATGNVVFATLVDDPASVGEIVDAYLGEIMLEAASAADAPDAGLAYAGTIIEATTAADSSSATITAAGVGTAWNPADKSANVTLSNGDLTATVSSTTVAAVRAVKSQTAGKYYVEVTATGTIAASYIGIATGAVALASIHGSTQAVLVRCNDGSVWRDGSYQGISITGNFPFASGDVIGIAVDFGAQKLWFRQNGGLWDNNGTHNPATGTGGFDISPVFASTAAYPTVTFASTGLTHTANFGPSAFAQTVPSGFTAGWPA